MEMPKVKFHSLNNELKESKETISKKEGKVRLVKAQRVGFTLSLPNVQVDTSIKLSLPPLSYFASL